jgi:hypothetical protein
METPEVIASKHQFNQVFLLSLLIITPLAVVCWGIISGDIFWWAIVISSEVHELIRY